MPSCRRYRRRAPSSSWGCPSPIRWPMDWRSDVVPARPQGRADLEKTRAGARLPRQRRCDAARSHGLLQSIYVYGVDLPPDATSMASTASSSGPSAGRGRRALLARQAGLNYRLATPTTDDKRPGRARQRRASSITSRSRASLARRHPTRKKWRRRSRGSSAIQAAGLGLASVPGAGGGHRIRGRWRVVGSALVSVLKGSLDPNDNATENTVSGVVDLVAALARGVRGASADKSTRSAPR